MHFCVTKRNSTTPNTMLPYKFEDYDDSDDFMDSLAERLVYHIENAIQETSEIPSDYRWKYCWFNYYYMHNFEGQPPEWFAEYLISMMKERIPVLKNAYISLTGKYFHFTWD
jgi:hypothetical protein